MTADRPAVGVLISGRGSNLQALIDAAADPAFPARIALVLSNKADAYGLERARAAGIATAVISHRDYAGDRAAFDAAMSRALKDAGCEFLCLAGFMRILSEGFVEEWRGKAINIHPSLLPAYRGLDTHARAIADGAQEHGCTVHFVTPGLDEGPAIIQAAVPVIPGDDEAALAARVLSREHDIYPRALGWLAQGRAVLDGERALIDGQPGPLRV